MKGNRMDNIVECAYNMDNGYVEVWFTDGNMLRIKCEEVEAALRTTEQSLAKLHKLLFGTIVQGYLKKGYNRAAAEMVARELFGYES